MKLREGNGHRRLPMLMLALIAAIGLVAAACSSTTPKSKASTATISASTKGSITFWTWVKDMDKEVALFNKKYPNIKVNVVNAGQGSDEYKKLQTALKAGKGAPDVAQIEYQYVPTFTITNSLLDLAPYGASALQAKFVDWAWGQVAKDGKVFAIPQDTGPMGMLYRQDLFDKYGIAVPKTWDEFAAAAKTLHDKDPKVYLTDLPPNEPGAYVGLEWQAGARPFDVQKADTVGVLAERLRRQEGLGLLERSGQGRHGGHRSRLHRCLVPGARVGQVRDLADRRLGSALPAGHREGDGGEVAGRAAAAVVRGRAGGRQLGRFDDCGHQADQAARGRRRIRDVLEQ